MLLILVQCGKFGHNEAICFKINDFPIQDSKCSKFGNTNRKICTYCNRSGLVIDIYYKKHGYALGYRPQHGMFSQANNNVTQEENSGGLDQNKQNNIGDLRITQHQYQILSDILKNVNNSNNQVQQVGSIFVDH